MSDVKETKELVVGFLKLAKVLAESFKDGVQVADAAVILAKVQEPEMMALLKAAYEDVEKVKVEAADISAAEAFELIIVALPELKALVEALQPKKV